MAQNYRTSRILAITLAVVAVSGWLVLNPKSYESNLVESPESSSAEPVANSSASETELSPLGQTSSSSGASASSDELEDSEPASPLASDLLEELPVRGRTTKAGYSRDEFYSSWPTIDGCSLRQRIIRRELGDSAVISSEDNCTVISGEFDEPYTGSHMIFYQKSDFSSGIQIDHVVALSDAWQKGAQKLSKSRRYELATDPLNLLAVDAKTNQGKSDGDAASWLPPNKKFRCTYVTRQISVKYKYSLWVTEAEKNAIKNVLTSCPSQRAVGV